MAGMTGVTMFDSLKVAWFDRWNAVIDDALGALPEASTCPHELYRMLAEDRGAAPKRTAVVTRHGSPVAVICVRKIGRFTWEPVTQWITPGIVCPAVDGYILPAIAALRSDVVVGWWRMNERPAHRAIRWLETTPVHRVRTAEREAYWRSTRQWKTVTHARRRCENLEVCINAPGAAEHVIRRWEQKWRATPHEDPALGDRILVAQFLERVGRHHTITLVDGDGRVLAGSTSIIHGDTCTAGVLYRDSTAGNLPTGVRAIDAFFDLAEHEGCSLVDLGGGHDYKLRWAPVDGDRCEFLVSPPYLHHPRQLARRVRSLVRKPAELTAAGRGRAPD